jgi:hypothetical protein
MSMPKSVEIERSNFSLMYWRLQGPQAGGSSSAGLLQEQEKEGLAGTEVSPIVAFNFPHSAGLVLSVIIRFRDRRISVLAAGPAFRRLRFGDEAFHRRVLAHAVRRVTQAVAQSLAIRICRMTKENKLVWQKLRPFDRRAQAIRRPEIDREICMSGSDLARTLP